MATVKTVATAAEHPEFIGIEVNPEALRRGGYAQTGPIRLPIIKPPAKAAKGSNNADLEMKGQFLAAGSHLIEWETFQEMTKHPFFNMLRNKGVIKVHMPELEEGAKVTGTSADYPLDSAIALIEVSNDEAWLERCIAKDDREGIPEACQQRIRDIKEQLKGSGSESGESDA